MAAMDDWQVRIEPVERTHGKLALGCWAFGAQWGPQNDADSRAALGAALEAGMNHFDTAIAYGRGHSEQVVGAFLAEADRRRRVFLATKGAGATGRDIRESLDRSLANLGVDAVDLYYIHWPRKGKDMRPVMEALEQARAEGKLRAIGVSNFSVQQMQEVSQVGTINAHQLCFNLFWRWPERDVIPWCRDHGVAVVTYSSIAEGILTGKFGPERPRFAEGDHRDGTVLFGADVWPHVYAGVEKLKAIAADAGRPLVEMAIRWVASRPAVTSILVGCRNAEQVARNAAAMAGEIADDVFEKMTAVSDETIAHVPDTGNIFRYYP